jgi:nucleoside phosphorylase
MISAAMEDELKVAMDLGHEVKRMQVPDVHLWRGTMGQNLCCFLKTGVGPEKSAGNLEKALDRISPDRILVIGYAGGLDPQLQLGSLVAVTKASTFSLDKNHPDWDHVQLDGTYELEKAEDMASSAKSLGLNAVSGSALSSSHVLGKPEYKNSLFAQFKASAVDMETAFLARVAASRNISMSCMRTISDVAQDTFLEPFSFDPSAKITDRAKKLLDTGMAQTYREWKNHAAVAKASLQSFIEAYLKVM